jgi:hypothetical protein
MKDGVQGKSGVVYFRSWVFLFGIVMSNNTLPENPNTLSPHSGEGIVSVNNQQDKFGGQLTLLIRR